MLRAQLNEDFNDGDFTNKPLWTSSNSGVDFTIIDNKLRSNSSIANTSFFLSTESVLAMNTEWEFWVNLQFSTSGSNYTDIYVISDKSDLKATLINGYFVRIGNTDDEISLYKRSGTTASSVKIIDGVNGSVGSSNNTVKVRLKRDNIGGFTLEREVVAGNSSYFTEGTTTDLTHLVSSHFGILVQQSTASFFLKHFFDNIRINSIVIDSQPPVVSSVSTIDSNTIEITFNEAMDSLSAKIAGNYSISNNAGPILKILTTNDPAKFHLRLVNAFNSGGYLVSVSNVKDKNGNPISNSNTGSFTYIKPYIAQFGDVVINEIFADPSPQIDLPSVEFAELRNNTNRSLSLKNWKFSDSESSAIFSDIIINPYSFLIICAKADTSEYKSLGKVLGISPWPSLNNSGELLKLISAENLPIDSVRYFDTWYRNTAKKQGGWTLERKDPYSRCEGLFNWFASNNPAGGTPGKENSIHVADYDLLQIKADSLKLISDTTLKLYFNKYLNGTTLVAENFKLIPATNSLKKITSDIEFKEVILTFERKFHPGTEYQLSVSNLKDCSGNSISGLQTLKLRTKEPPPPVLIKLDTARIIITEIFADPSPEVGLPLAEFIEIYNPSKDTVDLDKWTINDPTTKATIRSQRILPGEYIILCAIADTIHYKSFGKTIGLNPWPSLNNAVDQVTLKSFRGRVVDSVAYFDNWYKNRVKKNGGWSLEKNDLLNNSCNGFYNWVSSSSTSGGTPGWVNSVTTSRNIQQKIKIDSLRQTSDSTVVLTLSSIPDTVHLRRSQFSIDNGIGKAIAISIEADYLKINLRFGQKFHEGKNYLLTADSLFNCRSEISEVPNNRASFTIPTIPEIAYPIVINEILADPTPKIGLPETEFVELYNPTERPVSLKGMSYGDEGFQHNFTSGEIAAKSYLILCPEKDTTNYSAFGKVEGLHIWPSLTNERGVLILKNNKGKEFQRVAYNTGWYKDTEKKNGGYSLEMINTASICVGSQNWGASKAPSGGTPGKENSIHSSDSGEPLKLLEALITDSTTLLLTFNKPIDSLSASILNNYQLNNGIGEPASVLPLLPGFEQVLLKLKEPPTRGHWYSIEAKGLTDCLGSGISTSFNSKDFFLAERIVKNAVLVSEVLFNPGPDGVDFVEIYNNTKNSLDLQELSIATNVKDTISVSKRFSINQLLLEPGQYMAITSNPEVIKKEYRTEKPEAILKAALPAFNDDKGTVILLSNGVKIDQLNYNEKMHFQLLKQFDGVSLERSSFEVNTNEPGNFRSATSASGFATPGYKNSQYISASIGGDEFALPSRTFSPDNDGFEDLLQINYNLPVPGMVANVKIFNDKGMLIRYLLKNSTLNNQGILMWDGLNDFNKASDSGIYVVYAEIFDTNGTVKVYRKSFALAIKP